MPSALGLQGPAQPLHLPRRPAHCLQCSCGPIAWQATHSNCSAASPTEPALTAVSQGKDSVTLPHSSKPATAIYIAHYSVRPRIV